VASDALSSAELALIAKFLDTAAEEFADHGCNDFLLPATDENKAIFTAVLEHHDKSGDSDHQIRAEEINAAADDVFIYDDWAMAYFAERCGKFAGEPGTAALSHAELFAIGDLLVHVYEDHEGSSDDVDHDVSLPASGEHRAILAETIKLYRTEDHPEAYGREVAARLASIVPAFLRGGEVGIPDFWIMCQLAHKCRRLSGSEKPLYEPEDTAKYELNETEWDKRYVPTAADLRADELRKEVRDLARTRFKKARAEDTLAGDRYLSMLILADTDAERDALFGDKEFLAALGLIRKKATLQGFELLCFAFLSQDDINNRYSDVVVWWAEGVCPQIRYDQALGPREKAARMGASQEILDLMAKSSESGASAAANAGTAPETQVPERKGVAAFLRKHWLIVGFFAFFLAVLILGKSR
jgi:hypothetical protein